MRLAKVKDSTFLPNLNNNGNNIITITIIVAVLQFRGSPAINFVGWYFSYLIIAYLSANTSPWPSCKGKHFSCYSWPTQFILRQQLTNTITENISSTHFYWSHTTWKLLHEKVSLLITYVTTAFNIPSEPDRRVCWEIQDLEPIFMVCKWYGVDQRCTEISGFKAIIQIISLHRYWMPTFLEQYAPSHTLYLIFIYLPDDYKIHLSLTMITVLCVKHNPKLCTH